MVYMNLHTLYSLDYHNRTSELLNIKWLIFVKMHDRLSFAMNSMFMNQTRHWDNTLFLKSLYEFIQVVIEVGLLYCWRTNCCLYMSQFYTSTYWGREWPPICILCRYYLITFYTCVFKDKVLYWWKRIMQLAYASCSIIGVEWTERKLESTYLHARFELYSLYPLVIFNFTFQKVQDFCFLLLISLVSLFFSVLWWRVRFSSRSRISWLVVYCLWFNIWDVGLATRWRSFSLSLLGTSVLWEAIMKIKRYPSIFSTNLDIEWFLVHLHKWILRILNKFFLLILQEVLHIVQWPVFSWWDTLIRMQSMHQENLPSLTFHCC